MLGDIAAVKNRHIEKCTIAINLLQIESNHWISMNRKYLWLKSISHTLSSVSLCVSLSLLSSPLPARLSCLYLTSLSLSSLKSENIPTSPTPIEKTVSRYCDCGMQLLSYGVCRYRKDSVSAVYHHLNKKRHKKRVVSYGLLVKWHPTAPQLPVTMASATTSQKGDQDDSGKSRVRNLKVLIVTVKA